MAGSQARILVAAPAAVVRELGSLVADEAHIRGAGTFEQAVAVLGESDLLILCYAFDGVRPFRLLHYMRNEGRRHVRTILVRALPVPIGKTEEADIAASYKRLGADEFFNLHGEGERHGTAAALQQFRHLVLASLPRRPEQYQLPGQQ